MNDLFSTFNKSVVVAAILGSLIALLSRANHYVKNPHEIPKHRNGKVNIKWLIFVNTTAILIGGVVAFIACIVIKHYHWVDDDLLVPLAGMFGATGNKIFDIIQNRLIKKTENTMDQLGL
jgi:ABC-type iron transport system FetAB permease component